ncbi:phosphatidylinositol 3-kinase C2 domain-containing subunit gamma isoform X2 [Phyllobates terribilis]|uniref:phosphatidylinositol 3-kinase C2 domain-containing subunit gamma isoform X2 n=1 Tax=Phyllobates terribilis TaxID=111132 RepID=UPI003CCB55F5
MDWPINIGFSDHVMNFCSVTEAPQFPAPTGFHHVPVNLLNEPAPPDVYGPSPLQMYGHAHPDVFASAPAEVYGPSRAEVYGPSPPQMYGPTNPDIFASAPAEVYGPSRAEVYGPSPPQMYGPTHRDVFASAPPVVYGPSPAEVYGPSPAEVYGPSPAEVYGPSPAEVYGPSPAEVYGPSRAEVHGPAPPTSSRTPVAAAPYGFITDNWMEERLSWFPQSPSLLGEDTDEDMAPVTGVFWIGFENCGDLSDPSVHHIHSIGQPGPARRDTWSRGRSRTLDATPWPGEGLYADPTATRRRSLYDVHMGAAHGRSQEPPTSDWRIKLREAPGWQEPEVAAFCAAVCRIRQGFPASDRSSNSGRIWSAAVPFPENVRDSEVEISITGADLHPALHIVQRDSVHVEDLFAVILQQIADRPPYPPSHQPPSVTLQHLYPTLQPAVPQRTPGQEAEPALTICGLDEYIQPGHSLRSHAALQRRRSVRLRLHMVRGDPRPPLARTTEDDQMELSLGDRLEHAQYWDQLRKRLFEAVSQYEYQAQDVLCNQSASVGRVLEAVKEICYLLRSVETLEVSAAVCALSVSARQNWTQSLQMMDQVPLALLDLSHAVSRLLGIYSRSFHTDFMCEMNKTICRAESRSAFLSFRLSAAHNLPENWIKSDSLFYVSCSVIYAGRKISQEVNSRSVAAAGSFFFRAVWDEMISFPVPASSLPYESMLLLRLYAVTPPTPRGSFLAWSCRPLYDDQHFVRGEWLLNMTSHTEPPPVITPGALETALPTLITVQVDFPDLDLVFRRPLSEDSPCDAGGENPALRCLAHRCSVLLLSEMDRQSLWFYRRSPLQPPGLLPLILGSAPGWDPPTIAAMYRVLEDGSFSHPLEALALLSPSFADEQVRAAACRELERLSCDELMDILPQLVQAVKFEWRLDSALVRLLLQRCLQSIQLAHSVYWLLTDAASEPHYRGWYQRLLGAVHHCVGRAVSDQLSRQKRLMGILGDVAETVKNAPEDKRQEALKLGLHKIHHFFEEVENCRLPLNPAIVVKGIDQDSCTFFKSNAKPLKISFINGDEDGPNIHVMYKVGDDLRQDMLVLQMVALMDRIWLHEGLDLRMISYKCVSTGRRRGLIHLVPDSTTLAKIQHRSGLLGPLKDSSMRKWFQNNQTASDNFLCSCAGWCVVTFLLGVCDRHNDNIMLTSSGHMFHIDFGKFLGHAQMFGKIKRDRAPFIFTTEMESFITQEGRCPQRAQDFVELCCCAYNMIRRHSRLILALLELMLQAGLPELCTVEDVKYVHEKLRPSDSDLEAAHYFTSKIKESLESPSVKLNFLIHAFANMTPSDLSGKSEAVTPSLTKFIRRATAKSVQKVQKASGRILSELGVLVGTEPAGTADCERSVQLHVSFSAPRLWVLLKHLRNIYLPDGSESSSSVIVSLHTRTCQISSHKVKSQARTCAPIFNQLLQFSAPQLDGYFLKILVQSRGTSLGQLRLPLSTVRLQEDIWYRLGA